MPFGFSFSNPPYGDQIDGEYANYSVAETGRVYAPPYDRSDNSAGSHTFRGAYDAPLIMFKAPSSAAGAFQFNRDSQGRVRSMLMAGGATLDYAILYRPSPVPFGSWGIEVRNASNTVVFNSEEPFIRILSMQTVRDGDRVSVQDAFNSYFILTPLHIFQSAFEAGQGINFISASALQRVSSRTIEVSSFQFSARITRPNFALNLDNGVTNMMLIEATW